MRDSIPDRFLIVALYRCLVAFGGGGILRRVLWALATCWLGLTGTGCGPGTFGGTWGGILSPSPPAASEPEDPRFASPPPQNSPAAAGRNLLGMAITKIYGPANREQGILPGSRLPALTGFSVETGDLNGDGVADIVIGAPQSEGILPSISRSGWVYVVFGGRSLPAEVDLAAHADVSFWAGKGAGDNRLGQALACADFNGDGIEDLAIGAPEGASQPFHRIFSGSVYIVFGKASLKGTVDLSKEADVTLVGAEEGDRAGFALANGDVNGDGLADLIIGAPGAYGFQNQTPGAGETYLIFGRARFPRGIDLSKHWNSRIFGIDGSEFRISLTQDLPDGSGSAVAAGDVNGDGVDDVIVGAPSADGFLNQHPEAGEAYVLFGRQGFAKDLHLGRHADAVVYGERSGDRAGGFLHIADVSGNPVADWLIGSSGAIRKNTRSKLSGLLHRMQGTKTPQKSQRLETDAEAIYFGPPGCTGSGRQDFLPDAVFGRAAVFLHLDSDGNEDFLTGMPCSDGGNAKASGEILTFSHRRHFVQEDQAPARQGPTSRYQPQGIRSGEAFGYALALGDVDGNGRVDAVVGAPGMARQQSGPPSGGVYILKDLAPASLGLP